MMTTAIITMAGFGRRFLEAGYSVPKYRIVVHGRPLFQWSMLSLKSFIESGTSFVFVTRAEDDAENFINEMSASLNISVAGIVQLGAPTDGQATTAIAAGSMIHDRNQPILIYNIDTFVHPTSLLATSVRGEGWIPCFSAEGEAWSFAAVADDGRVFEVREKTRISPHATIGLYWFASFDLYDDAYRRHYSEGANLEMGERFVAPLYNTLIADGRAVYIQDIPVSAVVPLGVPADVHKFSEHAPPPEVW
jgi:dTDP-glucose pyrophosphorylase